MNATKHAKAPPGPRVTSGSEKIEPAPTTSAPPAGETIQPVIPTTRRPRRTAAAAKAKPSKPDDEPLATIRVAFRQEVRVSLVHPKGKPAAVELKNFRALITRPGWTARKAIRVLADAARLRDLGAAIYKAAEAVEAASDNRPEKPQEARP